MPLSRRQFVQSTLSAAALAASPLGTRAAAAGKGKKILILGGTKFLGPALVAAAKARGHTLTLFNRGKTNPHLFPELEKLQGDRDGKLDALAGRKWDAVIDDRDGDGGPDPCAKIAIEAALEALRRAGLERGLPQPAQRLGRHRRQPGPERRADSDAKLVCAVAGLTQ